jgi:hypothetical protein
VTLSAKSEVDNFKELSVHAVGITESELDSVTLGGTFLLQCLDVGKFVRWWSWLRFWSDARGTWPDLTLWLCNVLPGSELELFCEAAAS